MLLHEIPFDELRVGDVVMSYRDRLGTISKLDKNDDLSVWVEWSMDGQWKDEPQRVSHYYHSIPALNPITYLGKQN